jgi:ABC-type multidrug transport system permease subunit
MSVTAASRGAPSFVDIVCIIAQKDLTLLVRDRGALFWAGVFPILFAILFGAVFPASHASDRLAVAWTGPPAIASALEGHGLALRATSIDEGRALVRRGAAIAAIAVRDDAVEITADPTHPAESTAVELALTTALATSRCASLPTIRRRDFGAREPTNGFATAFPTAILWGLIGCAGTFATGSVSERKSGTYARLRAAPIGNSAILGGKVLACLVACVVDATLLLVVARVGFGVHVERCGSLPMAVASCALCFAGMTVFLGSIGRNEQSVGGAGWATLLLFAMIGGAMVPISVMPPWLRAVSDVSPVKWGIVALEGATVRGLDARELLPSCALLVAIGLACLASAAKLSSARA